MVGRALPVREPSNARHVQYDIHRIVVRGQTIIHVSPLVQMCHTEAAMPRTHLPVGLVDSDGTHTGEYQVEGEPPVLTVWYQGHPRPAPLGGTDAYVLARQLLRELVREQKKSK